MIIRRSSTLIAVTCISALIGAPIGYASPSQDQQYLDLVRYNGVAGGQDDALINFAQEYCIPGQHVLNTVWPLYGQGVPPQQIQILQIAASRIYCPDKIPVLPSPFAPHIP